MRLLRFERIITRPEASDYSFSNAIYEVEKKAHPDKEPYHSRQLEVKYTIKNETDNIVFMPFNTLSNDTCYSHLNVWFQSDSTQVKPFYTVIRFPCNSVYINPGDSINLTLRFFRFPDWQIKGCDVHTHSTKLISMLKVEYIADSLDINKYKSKYGITKLKFTVGNCYKNCGTCIEEGTSLNDQKCETCFDGYFFEENIKSLQF